jgi:hypothetical protein
MTRTVLITGARAAAALDLARDFHAAGWTVHLADCAPARICRWSKAAAKVHHYPSPVRAPAAFAAALAELAARLAPDLILPTCEEVFHLAAPSASRALADRLFQPPFATLRMLHDKHLFARLCEEIAVPVPETHRVESRAELDRYRPQSDKWVFKRCFSRFGEAALVGPAVDRLDAVAPSASRPWVAQRRVRGNEASFYAVAREGALTAFAAYCSDWRLRGGASIGFDPLGATDAALLQVHAARLARHLGLTGQFACDAMIDATGTAWLIECNPRATSGVHFLAGDGALARAIGAASPAFAGAAAQSLHLLPAMLTFGLIAALRERRLASWWRRLAGGRDVIGRPADRLPVLGALVDGLGFALTGLLRGTSASAATTADIEWNGEELP